MKKEKIGEIENNIKWVKKNGKDDSNVGMVINELRESILTLGEGKDMRNYFYRFNHTLLEVFVETKNEEFKNELAKNIVKNYEIITLWLDKGKKCNPKGDLESEKSEAKMWLSKLDYLVK